MSVIMVHGGVETGTDPPYIKVLRESAVAGLNALSSGHLKAAEEAVKVLENSPLFNAGYGSVLNLDGQAEMDAAVMDGETGRFGAVAAIRDVSNPVSVACRVLEETPHVLLAGEGAIKFARSMGFPPANCVTPEMMEKWRKAVSQVGQREAAGINLFTGMSEETGQARDTVGCVVSHRGLLAAASSTGGSFLKLPGRVGDTPVIGGGIFASRRCAVVCTGLGEAFIETLTAKYVDSLVFHGHHPQEAAEKAMARLAGSRRAPGGIIVADSRGRWGAAYNTRTFPVVLVVDGRLVEDFTARKIQG